MAKLNELKLSRFSLIQTAESGHGKTTRTLTATRFGPMFIFDFDGKSSYAANNVPKDILKTLPENWKSLIDVEDFSTRKFKDAIDKVKEFIALGDKLPYATLVIDTYTNLNENLYIEAMGQSALEAGIKADFSQWAVLDSKFLAFFNLLRQLNCNLIVNCHLKSWKDEETKKIFYGAAGRGGAIDKVWGRFADKHFLEIVGTKFIVRVASKDTLPCTNTLTAEFIDLNGCARVFDLSIFDAYALKKGG